MSRLTHVPGYPDIGRQEYEVAKTLKSVYAIELSKHIGTWKDESGRVKKLWQHELSLNAPSTDDDDSSDQAGEVREARSTKKRRHPDQIWLDLARLIMSHNISPHRFIRRQFTALLLDQVKGPPTPKQMHCIEAINACRDGDDMLADEITTAWSFQLVEFSKAVACCGYEREEAWAYVLLRLSEQLSALFRYCLAYYIADEATSDEQRLRFMRIAGMFKVDAVEQYLDFPEMYDKVWGVDRIPEDFRKSALTAYAERYGRRECEHGET